MLFIIAFVSLNVVLFVLALDAVAPAEKGLPSAPDLLLVLVGFVNEDVFGSVVPPASLNKLISGDCKGYFFITVMCSSSTLSPVTMLEPSPCSLTNFVVVAKGFEVAAPNINLFIFIFLGSFLLSVQNSKPSITLIPVIK